MRAKNRGLLTPLCILLLSACADEPLDLAVEHGGLEPDDEEILVYDQSQLDMRFEADGETLALGLWTGDAWEPVSGGIVDLIARESAIEEVSARFQPEVGVELRMRFRAPNGDWEAWSTWTSGRIERRLAVPAPGQALPAEFEAEARGDTPRTHTWVCGPSNCIKLKKLTS